MATIYKIPCTIMLPDFISPKDVLYPRRNYYVEFRQALEKGQLCDIDSFIVEIIEMGLLAKYLKRITLPYTVHLKIGDNEYHNTYNGISDRDLYIFMRRWGLIGDTQNRQFRVIAKELGLKSCGWAEECVKNSIKRAYESDMHKKCDRVKEQILWKLHG